MREKTIVFINHGGLGKKRIMAKMPERQDSASHPAQDQASLPSALTVPSVPADAENKSPYTCTTVGCIRARQPGREKCADCLQKAMPKNSRTNMVEGFSGSGSGNYGD
jgi:hypothetical protein